MTDTGPGWLRTLRTERSRPVPDEVWQLVVSQLWSGAGFVSAEPLIGGLGGLLDRVRANDLGGTERTVVVRRFFPEWDEEAAAVERATATLQVLEAHEAPTPRSLWCDGSGEMLGRPALAMTDLPGHPVAASLDPAGAALVGRLLASLHRIPGIAMEHVPDPGDIADQVAAELRRSEPREDDFIDRTILHDALARGAELVAGQPETFRHDDFHPGNVLRDGAEGYVIDLSWSGRGDPGRDVGYCRLDLALTADPGTQEAFLDGYRAGGGVVPEHLWLYDLMGALRSLPTPAEWLPAFHELGRSDLTAQQFESRARAFVADALARGRVAGVLGTLDQDDVRAGSSG